MNATNSTTYDTNYIASSYSGLTWDLWLRVFVAFFGILANLLNIAVLMNRKLKDITYKYMLVNAFANVIYLSLSLSSVFYYYCTICPSSQTYLAGIFSISLTFYVFDSLKLLHVLLEIAISTRIYLILVNNSWFNRISYKLVMFALVLISLVFFLQEPFSYEIVDMGRSLNGMEIYEVNANRFGSSVIGLTMVLVQFIVRIFLAVFVLSFVNVLNVVEFRKRYLDGRSNVRQRNSRASSGAQNQSNDANEENTNGNPPSNLVYYPTKSIQTDSNHETTSSKSTVRSSSKQSNSRRSNRSSLIRMVIFSSFLNALGTVPYSVVYIIQQIISHYMISLLFNLSIVLLYALLALDTFVYYSFNKLYAKVLRSYFRTVRIRFIRC